MSTEKQSIVERSLNCIVKMQLKTEQRLSYRTQLNPPLFSGAYNAGLPFNQIDPFFCAQIQNTMFLPVFAYTLRCLAPRCCRVSLQPRLLAKVVFSFVGLHGAQTLVPKPDCSESLRFSAVLITESGTTAPQKPLNAHLLTTDILIKNVHGLCKH
ncbi:hypothetical protein ACFE6N_22500 [Pedobacter sp. BG31]|uniref:hypothetical protein n=1 Tax=Pedobacter sp. BG31 TaxID=3349697 RepID=UPI0035F3926B